MRKILSFGAASAQGEWPIQEDAYWVDSVNNIFLLADGIGGEGAGDKIAALAVTSAGDFLSKHIRENTEIKKERPFFTQEEEIIFQAFAHVNQKILENNQGKKLEEQGGASLFIAVFFLSGRTILGNIGATSASILRENRMISFLRPQTMYQSRGYVSSKDPSKIGSDFPLQFLGLHNAIDPEIRMYHFLPKDRLAFYSSGFQDFLLEAPNYLEEHFRQWDADPSNQDKSLEELVKKLVVSEDSPSEMKKSKKNTSLVLVDYI